MSRYLKIPLLVFGIAWLSLLVLAPSASAQFRRGWVGWGPGWYGPGWGWYGGWYGPYAYGWGYPEEYARNAGEVKFVNVPKDAMVYVDGGYAGTVGKLKKFPLRPGNHNLELRDPSGHPFQQEKIDVIPGKTIEIRGTAGGH